MGGVGGTIGKSVCAGNGRKGFLWDWSVIFSRHFTKMEQTEQLPVIQMWTMHRYMPVALQNLHRVLLRIFTTYCDTSCVQLRSKGVTIQSARTITAMWIHNPSSAMLNSIFSAMPLTLILGLCQYLAINFNVHWLFNYKSVLTPLFSRAKEEDPSTVITKQSDIL